MLLIDVYPEIISNFLSERATNKPLKTRPCYLHHGKNKFIAVYIFFVKGTGVTFLSTQVFPRMMLGLNPFLLYLIYYVVMNIEYSEIFWLKNESVLQLK